MEVSEIAQKVANEIILEKHTVQKPRIFVLMGLQYAGKSYLAEKIVEKNYTHFWATKIKKTYGIANPEMIEVGLEVIERVSSIGYNLVIDFVNHKYAMRRQFQDEAQRLAVSYQVIFIDTSRQERLQRREINIQEGDKSGRRVISLEQIQEFEREFELPQDTEPTITLRTQFDILKFLETL